MRGQWARARPPFKPPFTPTAESTPPFTPVRLAVANFGLSPATTPAVPLSTSIAGDSIAAQSAGLDPVSIGCAVRADSLCMSPAVAIPAAASRSNTIGEQASRSPSAIETIILRSIPLLEAGGQSVSEQGIRVHNGRL
eukprot:scaffold12174_cov121-Isochrysis_galbana.AAC.6